MRDFNDGKPFHGSDEVEEGRLTGSTDTDYFYFFCPKCGDTQILQVLDYGVVHDGPVDYAKEHRKKARRDFTLAFELFCQRCELHNFVKISNTGWQGGKLSESPVRRSQGSM